MDEKAIVSGMAQKNMVEDKIIRWKKYFCKATFYLSRQQQV